MTAANRVCRLLLRRGGQQALPISMAAASLLRTALRATQRASPLQGFFIPPVRELPGPGPRPARPATWLEVQQFTRIAALIRRRLRTPSATGATARRPLLRPPIPSHRPSCRRSRRIYTSALRQSVQTATIRRWRRTEAVQERLTHVQAAIQDRGLQPHWGRHAERATQAARAWLSPLRS